MNLGLKELRRRPGRFGAAAAALVLISVLTLFLGGLLDGLYLGSTGALRAQPGELMTFSDNSKLSVIRSRITPEQRSGIAKVDGVTAVGGVGFALVAATVPERSEPASVAVIGYELAPKGLPAPPVAGEAFADQSLESKGVRVGQVLAVGPRKLPIKVVGFVPDTNFLQQGALWTAPDTWREVLASARPDQTLPPGTFQAITVQTATPNDPVALATVAASIDRSVAGVRTVTTEDAVLALPGIKEQNSTFTAIIGVTLLVAGIVVALFFALLTLERTGMFAVFKAVGASSVQVFAGVIVQAVVVALSAFVVSVVLVFLAAAGIGDALPLTLVPQRLVSTAVALIVTAALGAAISLRRVVRIDPAAAIG